MNELQWRMLDWMLIVLLPDVELDTEEGLDKLEEDLEGLMDSPGFEEEFGRDVPDELLHPLLDLEYEVYQDRATVIYNKQLTQGG
jgi:hypothetical protein